MSAITRDPDELHKKAFKFHSVTASQTGFVRNEATMKDIKKAAGEYMRDNPEPVQDLEHPRIILSENTFIPLTYEEPKDTAKVKTICKNPSARGIVFVPAPTPSTSESVPITTLNSLIARLDIKDREVEALITRLDIKDQEIGDLTARLKVKDQEIGGLTARLKVKDQEIGGLTARLADLKEKTRTLQADSEDIVDWLITNDSKSMDRLRLRHVLDCGQARLARVTCLPVVTPPRSTGDLSRLWRAQLSDCLDNNERLVEARNLIRNCSDAETRNLSDEVLHLLVDSPSTIRTAADGAAHPSCAERGYQSLISRQPLDKQAILQEFITYGTKFVL